MYVDTTNTDDLIDLEPAQPAASLAKPPIDPNRNGRPAPRKRPCRTYPKRMGGIEANGRAATSTAGCFSSSLTVPTA